MHVLQIGAAKSGNLWLYKIIDHILTKSGTTKKSVVREHPIHSLAKTWPLSYPEQSDIDMLDIKSLQCRWRISTVFSMPVDNIREYVSSASHVWTHSRICHKSLRVYPMFDKVVYIVRDPRDRAVSEAKFAFTDYMQQFDPSAESSYDEYLDVHLENMMNRWRWHVYDHIRYAKEFDIHVMFYERLLHNFMSELEKLLDYLEIELSEVDKKAIADAVSFSSMKKENPGHLRKGSSGDWKEHFSREQEERIHSIIRPMTSYLNYDSPFLPHLPDFVDKELLERELNEIGKHYYP